MHCEQRDAAVDTENKGQPRLPFCILFNNDSMNHLRERDCDEDGRHHVHHAHFGGAGKVQPKAAESSAVAAGVITGARKPASSVIAP